MSKSITAWVSDLIKHRDGCHDRLKAIEGDRRKLVEEEKYLGDKIELLNKTISLFKAELRDGLVKPPKKYNKKKSAYRDFSSREGDLLPEVFAPLEGPFKAAKICQDVRATLKKEGKHCSIDDIAAAMVKKYDYVKSPAAFRSRLSQVLKVAREAKGTWLAFERGGSKLLYKHG